MVRVYKGGGLAVCPICLGKKIVKDRTCATCGGYGKISYMRKGLILRDLERKK